MVQIGSNGIELKKGEKALRPRWVTLQHLSDCGKASHPARASATILAPPTLSAAPVSFSEMRHLLIFQEANM